MAKENRLRTDQSMEPISKNKYLCIHYNGCGKEKSMENVSHDIFEAAMVRDWTNALISSMEHRRSLDRLNSQIETILTPDYIQIYSGIEILADVLGCELLEKKREDEYNEYYFFYRDVKFLKLSEERLGKYADGAN